jgi:transcriptional regulator with XRE-family HTH domain
MKVIKLMSTLREVRAERLLSIRELARQASVAPSTVYLIESGRSMPRPRVVRQLAAVLGVEPQEIDEFRRVIEATKVSRRRIRRAPRADGTK